MPFTTDFYIHKFFQRDGNADTAFQAFLLRRHSLLPAIIKDVKRGGERGGIFN